VELQNARIEAQQKALTDLLRSGLRSLEGVSDPELTAGYRTGDPAGITIHAESALTAMPLPRFIITKARALYSPCARQLLVEYELPTVDVVPKAKSYRYVKSRETVVETARPVSRVKALYASVITQITLLAVAAIMKCDSVRHIDVVVFNGYIDRADAVDPQSAQPIRPCLIAVRVSRDAWADIDLRDVDPAACLKRLSATVSDNPTGFVSVRPLT
jgi:restriction system protein